MPNPKTHTPDVPDGFTVVSTSNQEYLIPQYALPDLLHAFDVRAGRDRMQTWKAARTSSQVSDRPSAFLDGIRIPPNPDHTDEERLKCHAEILALQERFGITYKDASHRLCMASLEKLKALDVVNKGLANERARMRRRLADFQKKYADPELTANADTEDVPNDHNAAESEPDQINLGSGTSKEREGMSGQETMCGIGRGIGRRLGRGHRKSKAKAT